MMKTQEIQDIDDVLNKIVELFQQVPSEYQRDLITEDLLEVMDCDHYKAIAKAAIARCTTSEKIELGL